MSYRYLYGFTDDPSYDFTRVIYFGKQDRSDINLKRVIEHYRSEDPNHEELSKAKFVIFSQVPTRVSLANLEAYFIQTYCPKLNCVYNTDKNEQPKLNASQLEEIRPDAEALVWNLIRNDKASAMSMNWVLSEIEKQNSIINNAAITFKSRHSLDTIKCLDLALRINKEKAVILPVVSNSLVHPIFFVTADDEFINIEPYRNTSLITQKKPLTESIRYQTIFRGFFLPELDIFVNDFAIDAREFLTSDLNSTGELDEIKEEVFKIWVRALYLFLKKLYSLEHQYLTNLPVINLAASIDEVCNYNCGFNSKNWRVIEYLRILLYHDIPYPQERTLHIHEFIEDDDRIKDILQMTAEDFIAMYEAKKPEDIFQETQLLQCTSIDSWLEDLEDDLTN